MLPGLLFLDTRPPPPSREVTGTLGPSLSRADVLLDEEDSRLLVEDDDDGFLSGDLCRLDGECLDELGLLGDL